MAGFHCNTLPEVSKNAVLPDVPINYKCHKICQEMLSRPNSSSD